jgi:hypothetical protein
MTIPGIQEHGKILYGYSWRCASCCRPGSSPEFHGTPATRYQTHVQPHGVVAATLIFPCLTVPQAEKLRRDELTLDRCRPFASWSLKGQCRESFRYRSFINNLLLAAIDMPRKDFECSNTWRCLHFLSALQCIHHRWVKYNSLVTYSYKQITCH